VYLASLVKKQNLKCQKAQLNYQQDLRKSI